MPNAAKIMVSHDTVQELAILKSRLAALDRERSEIAGQLGVLERTQAAGAQPTNGAATLVTMVSPEAAKIALFRSLFRGREDVFARRWENPRTAKSGYAPACRNEWARGL